MNIQYYAKNVYGRVLFFLLDEKLAASFASLTGRKTLTDDDMTLLSAFGHVFEHVAPPLESLVRAK